MGIVNIEVKQKNKDEKSILTGMNTQLFVNGIPLRGATRFILDIIAGDVAKVTIETHLKLEDLNINIDQNNLNLVSPMPSERTHEIGTIESVTTADRG